MDVVPFGNVVFETIEQVVPDPTEIVRVETAVSNSTTSM
jgi:hypothetical protein